jgi:2,3-bisphosphoglycerate-independent phosphoglycerate mutase
MLKELPGFGDYTLVLMPDHATPSKLKTHSNEPVPFATIRGGRSQIGATAGVRPYTEAEASRSGVVVNEGYRLIEALFGAAVQMY